MVQHCALSIRIGVMRVRIVERNRNRGTICGMGLKKQTTNARFSQFLQPVLNAIRDLGGSARPSETKEWILRKLELPDDYVNSVHQGGESKFGNDVDWARYYLVRAGYLDASKRGVWSLTETGRIAKIDSSEAARILRTVEKRVATQEQRDVSSEADPDTKRYVEQALQILRTLPSKGFENLCQRLLRESGFEEVTVTGRSGDGGIDGQGILKINPFVSFRVLFQCKRFKDSVGPAVVRDFRGAMAGRADKGIILSTGYFTPQAELEASRDGAQPIELVDGESLVNLLGELELGLRPIKSFEVEERFFQQFE
jgi:restriction system protein